MVFFRKKKIVLFSPMKGEVIALDKVPDPVFAGEMIGKGFAVLPEEGKVHSPINGEVVTVFETKHAIGLVDENGVEILVHIGIDTVQLKGEHYVSHVKAGDKVKVGELITEFDIQAIKAAGYEVVTPVIVTNTPDFKEINVIKFGQTETCAEVLEIKK